VVAVVGPTASGKSDLAVSLALALGGEVVNADAMQLYRGMDIGTAKLGLDERRGVRHHLLDVLEVTDEASVAAYQRQARDVLAGLERDGRVAILTGGSGLYLRAVLDRIEIPPTDPEVRRGLEAELDRHGPAVLHARLARSDPTAASSILASNGRRIVRALEVIELTGRPFSATLPHPDVQQYHRPTVQIGLEVSRPVLTGRIADRVDRMWTAGLEAETRGLLARGLRAGRTASRALGYAQMLQVIDGRIAADEARTLTVAATRRFARRQQSWFGRDRRITWLRYDEPDLVQQALSVIAQRSLP
jgi:tRNA dimethylallyltransferase